MAVNVTKRGSGEVVWCGGDENKQGLNFKEKKKGKNIWRWQKKIIESFYER